MTDKRDRNKQFEIVEGLFTWYDDIMNHYEASFWVHYHILDRIINIWIEEVENNSDIPRVMYFVNTEYMSMVLCELLLTVETLFKAELVKAGFEEKLFFCPRKEIVNQRLKHNLTLLFPILFAQVFPQLIEMEQSGDTL